MLHWHKATFFPDFMPRSDASYDEDDIGSEEDEEELLFEEPSPARRVAYVASTTLVNLCLFLTLQSTFESHSVCAACRRLPQCAL